MDLLKVSQATPNKSLLRSAGSEFLNVPPVPLPAPAELGR